MKIVMIGTKGVPTKYGGVETHVDLLGSRLVRMGHDVLVYVRAWYMGEHAPKTYNGMRLVTVPTIPTKNLDAAVHTLFATLHALLFIRPDVYHFHSVGPSLFSWLPRIFAPRARVIATFHSLDRTHGKWGLFARLMLRLGEWTAVHIPHRTIVVSPTLVPYVAESCGGGEAVYIPNGILPRRVSLDPALLDPFGVSSMRYVLAVGRLLPVKSLHTLIPAWKKAREVSGSPLRDMKLVIVGDGVHTDAYVRTLHALAANDPSVVFTGFQTGASLEALYMGAAFFAHPSEREGLSLAILEAMSYGKAVLASDIPENLPLVEEAGVAVPVKDISAWAEALNDLAKDPLRAAALGRTARAFVEAEFHWDDIARKTIAVYRKKEHVVVVMLRELREAVTALFHRWA